jgi:hypothetical protein
MDSDTFYAALKDAVDALGATNDPVAVAAALNAQTGDPVAVDIPTKEARQVVLLTGEWYKIKQLSKQPLTGSVKDLSIVAADVCIDTLTLTDTIHAADAENWAAIQRMMGALVQAGVVSQASADAWAAMRMHTPPKWDRIITDQDVIAVKGKP